MSAHRKTRPVRTILLAGGAVAAVMALTGGTVAVAGSLIGSPGIKDNSLQSVDYKDGSMKERDTSGWMKRQLHKADTVPVRSHTSDPTTVTNVGGTFGKFTETVRATQLDSFILQPGKYVLNAELFTRTNVADPARDARMQLALRVNDGSEWGQDYGTAFTGALSPLANREASAHTTRVVHVTATTEVLVYAFGYEDDQGSAASGQVDAWSYVTAQRVGPAAASTS